MSADDDDEKTIDADEKTPADVNDKVYHATEGSMKVLYYYMTTIWSEEGYVPEARYDDDMRRFFSDFSVGFCKEQGRDQNQDLVSKYVDEAPRCTFKSTHSLR